MKTTLEARKIEIRQKQLEDQFSKKRKQFLANKLLNEFEEEKDKQDNLLIFDNDSLTLNQLKLKVQSEKSKTKVEKIELDNELQESLNNFFELCQKLKIGINDLPELSNLTKSNDIESQFTGVCGIKKILAEENEQPIQYLIDNGVIIQLIEALQNTNYEKLQIEAAWAIANIANGTTEQVKALIDQGIIKILYHLLKQPSSDELQLQVKNFFIYDCKVVWSIGNISGDSIEFRDQLLEIDIIPALAELIKNTKSKEVYSNGIWALSNLTRGRPLANLMKTYPSISIFCNAIKEDTDLQILTNSLWALSYISEGQEENDEEQVNLIVAENFVPSLIYLMDVKLKENSIIIPGLRILGNISSSDEIYTDILIASDVFPLLYKLLSSKTIAIRKESCWTLSNITAGTVEQVDNFLEQEELIEKLQCLINTDYLEIKRESIWVFKNALCKGSHHAVKKLIDFGIHKTISDLFFNSQIDMNILNVLLSSVIAILQCGKENFTFGGVNSFKILLEQEGIITKIQSLQYHDNEDIYQKTQLILNNFCETEDPLDNLLQGQDKQMK